jgi:amino acid transporter
MSAPSKIPVLRRELSSRHLTLFAVGIVIGTRPIAEAAHAGPVSIALWIIAAFGVLMPLAAACAVLTARSPSSGGLYHWARDDFGPWHGFLCFWIYWMGIAFWFPGAAMLYSSVTLYSLGPQYHDLADSRAWVLAVSLAATWTALGTNLVGMKIGKWTENVGAICGTLICVILGLAALAVWIDHGSATAVGSLPKWELATASSWPNIAFGMTGIEMVGMMGGEIVDPERQVPRSAFVAAVIGSMFYVLVTLSLLVLNRPERYSEMYGLAQGGNLAGQALGTRVLGPLVALLILGNAVGQFGGCGSAASRLPMAAGVDHLLPAAFARVHSRWATPHVSILVLGLVASCVLIAIQAGDGVRGAYNALVSLMTIGSFIPFLYIYASAWKAGTPVTAVVGMSVTLTVLICSAIPTGSVESVAAFEFKLAAGTLGMVISGWLVYRSRGRA